MSSYMFKCDACGKEFEKEFHLMDDKTDIACPFCHSKEVRRVYAAPYIVFKGPGFYVNDSHSDVRMRNTKK